MDNKMTAEQIWRDVDGIERRIACGEIKTTAVFTLMKQLVSQALSAPRVQDHRVMTFWVVYDATSDKKYIKKDAVTGELAMFDHEHEAKAVSAANKGTAFKKVEYVQYTDASPEPASDTQQVIADLRAEVEALKRGPNLKWPLDKHLQGILGRPCFDCAQYAPILRALGQDIPQKAEAEQAAVIAWMLGHYLADQDNWMSRIADDIDKAARLREGGE